MKGRVFVVDDDSAVRDALCNLLGAAGYQVRAFAAAADFLGEALPDAPACVVLDLRMPDVGGFDVVARLTGSGAPLPVIMLTGFGTISLSVRAMKAGAVEFLTKPVLPEALLRAVDDALACDAGQFHIRRELAQLRRCLDSLTPRERQTMELVIGGLLNKQVADALGVSEIMAKTHKRKVMEKMRARSLPDLVRGAERLHIAVARSR